ncbi:MAG: protein-disulfide reductase DsbD [Halorhodospira sp.]
MLGSLWKRIGGPAALVVLLGLMVPVGAPAQERMSQEEIFPFSVDRVGADQLVARWDVAEDHYLYEHQIDFKLRDGENEIVEVSFPEGESFRDEFFGDVRIHRGTVQVHLETARPIGEQAELVAEYQGCNEPESLCFPPSSVEAQIGAEQVAYSEAGGGAGAAGAGAAGDRGGGAMGELQGLLSGGNLWAILGGFFVAGLLLAFTACIYPMIPILSGLIVGSQPGNGRASTGRALWLSFVYVQAMAVTYALAGALAGLSGRAVQADLQGPVATVGFSLLFVVLALAMFGLFHLQMPASLQGRLQAASSRLPGGQAAGVAAMGALSTLIVGACSGPALVAALAFIGNTGEVLLGAAALYVMALGMGAPLLAVGTVAGRWMPRSGSWMEGVKQAFGFIFLGLAWWVSARLMPQAVVLLGWAGLLLAAAAWLAWRLRGGGAGSARLAGGALASLLALAGVAQVVGAVTGAGDPLRPWAGVLGGSGAEARARVLEEWRSVDTEEGLEKALEEAERAEQPVVLDFTADWCAYCIQLEERTLPDQRVHDALEGVKRLRVDVTEMTEADRALMASHDIYLPPAILFYGPDGEERREQRVVGFKEPEAFAERARQALERE